MPPPPRRRLRWLWGGLALLLALSGAGLLLHTIQLRSQRASALLLAEEGPFASAEPSLRDIARRSPADAEVAAALARGYLQQEAYPEAEQFLSRWAQLQPDDPQPRRLRLNLFRKQKRFAEALADARWLVESDPEDVDLRMRLAEVYFSLGEFQAADSELRSCRERQPRRRDVRRFLAQTAQALGRLDAAAALLDELLHEQPREPAFLMARGTLYLAQEQPDRAIPLLEQVIQTDPRRQRTGRYQLALAYSRAGREADARRVQEELRHLQETEVLDDALRSQPDSPDVQVRAARAWLASGKTAAALDLLGRILDKRPDDAAANLTLADYYDRIGQPDRAAEHRKRAGR